MLSKTHTPDIYLGCTQWWNPKWKSLLEVANAGDALSHYSRLFSTVEGNTTFYGVPKVDTQNKWMNSVPKAFRFCLKVPSACTHEKILQKPVLEAFVDMLHRFGSQVGQVHVQLPPGLGWGDWERVNEIVNRLNAFRVSIEVRHPSFYAKGEQEWVLNRWLQDKGFNRVMFDTRGLFNDCRDDEATRDAKFKKPRLPLHVLATSSQPMVRYIGFSDYEQNIGYLNQWAVKLKRWVDEGKTPYFFMHTADNELSPLYLLRFKKSLEDLGLKASFNESAVIQEQRRQPSLFD